LQGEEQAVVLYSKVPQPTPALFREHIQALEALAGDLRALGRGDDAVRTETELAALKGSLKQGPNPSADAEKSSR
jgi:hypothetical protein